MFSAHFSSRIRDSPEHVLVTVKLISKAQPGSDESNFVINGDDVTNVTIVGMVLNKNARVTDVSFTLGDRTGQISCTRDGMYVRINGRLRRYQGKQQLVAFSVRPVTNFDEVIYHRTECKQYQLKNKKAKMQGDFKIPSSQSGGPIVSMPTLNGSEGSQISALSEQFSEYGPKGLDQMVLDYLQQPSICGLLKGVHRDELSKKLKIPMEKIIIFLRVTDSSVGNNLLGNRGKAASIISTLRDSDGADGKGTLGKLLDTEGETHLDHNDPNYVGGEVIQTADKSYLSAPHHAELVEKRWGVVIEVVKKKISGVLREYVESGDTSEACRCIRELGRPFIYHEVVKQALILAMKTRAAEASILNLLKEASAEGLISSSQMGKGFTRNATMTLLYNGLIYSTIDEFHFKALPPYVLKEFDQMVLDYLQQPSIRELRRGVHRDELSKKLKIPWRR